MEIYLALRRQATVTNKAQKRVDVLTHRLEQARSKVARYHERSENSRGAIRLRHLSQMVKWEHTVLTYELELPIATEKHQQESSYLQEIQVCRTEVRAVANLRHSNKKLEMPHEMELQQETIRLDPVTLFVRLLSGEIQSVEVDGVQPVSEFAKEFVQQNGYHPSATKRMTFFFPPSEISSEEKEQDPAVRTILLVSEEKGAHLEIQVEEQVECGLIPFWTPEKHPVGNTFRDLFPRNQETPVFCLFIRPSDPSKRMDKIGLIRRILTEENRYNMYDDEELFSMYDGWYLTYRYGGNRYKVMKIFVASYPDKFWFMNEQEMEQSAAWNTQWKDTLRFKQFMIQDAQCISSSHKYHPRVGEIRIITQNAVRRYLGEGDHGLQQIQQNAHTFRYYMTLHELILMGVPPAILCRCQEQTCYTCHFPSWMERAGDFHIPPIVQKDHSADHIRTLLAMVW